MYHTLQKGPDPQAQPHTSQASQEELATLAACREDPCGLSRSAQTKKAASFFGGLPQNYKEKFQYNESRII